MQFFKDTGKAVFISRPNRFTVLCNLKSKRIKAFLPNPGRLQELLLPGVRLYLELSGSPGRVLPYTAVAVEKNGRPVILHTHMANRITQFLIQAGKIPGLEGAEVLGTEITAGRSRFDLLIKQGGNQILLEVKSCTLFSRKVAMFPDAVTERGKRHVQELAGLSGRKTGGAVLFLIHSPEPDYFMPEFHTDPDFSRALCEARQTIQIFPLALSWGKDLSLGSKTRLLEVPWGIVEKEARDRGCYMILMRLRRKTPLEVGKLGRIHFNPGYYIYVGSAKRNLSKRIERHRRLRKNKFWHIDYFRAVAEILTMLPIRSSKDLECELAGALSAYADRQIPGFGASDCTCPSHLFWTRRHPLDSENFHDLLQYYRMDRLVPTSL